MLVILSPFNDINFLAVFVAGLAYFALGALWYSVLFGKIWGKGIEEMGIKMSKPDNAGMMTMMLKSFAANLLCAFAVAWLVRFGLTYNLVGGIKLGIVCGCGLTLASIAMVGNWQNTKTSVLVIDAGYQIIGVTMVSGILAAWH